MFCVRSRAALHVLRNSPIITIAVHRNWMHIAHSRHHASSKAIFDRGTVILIDTWMRMIFKSFYSSHGQIIFHRMEFGCAWEVDCGGGQYKSNCFVECDVLCVLQYQLAYTFDYAVLNWESLMQYEFTACCCSKRVRYDEWFQPAQDTIEMLCIMKNSH